MPLEYNVLSLQPGRLSNYLETIVSYATHTHAALITHPPKSSTLAPKKKMTNQDYLNGDVEHEDAFATRTIHVGSTPDPVTGAVIPPLSLSTTYAQAGVGTAVRVSFFLCFRFASIARCSYLAQ